MTLPPKWEEPLYRSLARSIRDSIDKGQLQAGDQLPSQDEIARAASVNVRTVARAINLLVRDKVLVKRARGERARVALPPEATNGLSAPVEHKTHQRLHVQVQCVRTYGDIAEVSVTVQNGQQLIISTTPAAVEWLHLQEGQSATVDIKASEIGVATSWP
jgi:DNA-binding GntR family transcriptional regulator